MTEAYAGNPDNYPTTITLPSDDGSDTPDAVLFNTTSEATIDRTAYTNKRALDKLDGDVLQGEIAFSGSGQIDANIARAIVSAIRGGITLDLVAGGLLSSIVAGIEITIAGGLKTQAVKGISLAGGATDVIGYDEAHTVIRLQPIVAEKLNGAWSQLGFSQAVGGATNDAATFVPTMFRDGSVSGATLTSITVRIGVAPHSGLPTSMPTINVWRLSCNPGGAQSQASMWAAGAQPIPTPANGTAWHDGGNIQEFTFNTNQNNVIDLTQYQYVIELLDETGGGSAVAGNVYYGFELTFENILSQDY
jgi:hypothetical protein